jgi:6-phosphofructokinase 2
MPGAALTEEEFRRLEEKVLRSTGSLLVVSGSLPPGIGVDNLTQLVKSAQRHASLHH